VLGLQEAPHVRLVSDHELAHLRPAARDGAHVARERRHLRRSVRREGEGVDRLDREDDADAGRGGHGHHPIDEVLLQDLPGRVLVPEDDHSVLDHPEVGQVAEEKGAAVVGVLHRIVRDPEADRRRCAGTTPGAGGAEDACEQAEHERSEKEAAAAHGLGP